MNKLQKMALEDYLLENSDMNLKLFTTSINAMFILKAASKKEIVALLDKYNKDKSKLRLAAIESYLGITKTDKKIIKTAEIIPVIDNIDPIVSRKMEELSSSRRELLRQIKIQDPIKTGERQFELTEKIRNLEEELGLSDGTQSDSQIYNMGAENGLESKSVLFKSIFGDWEESGTAAWSLVHPNGSPQFTIDSTPWAGLWFSTANQQLFDNITYEVTGMKKQAYIITEDKSSQPSRWIFSKTAVRIQNVIRDSDGKVYGANAIDNMRNADFVPR